MNQDWVTKKANTYLNQRPSSSCVDYHFPLKDIFDENMGSEWNETFNTMIQWDDRMVCKDEGCHLMRYIYQRVAKNEAVFYDYVMGLTSRTIEEAFHVYMKTILQSSWVQTLYNPDTIVHIHTHPLYQRLCQVFIQVTIHCIDRFMPDYYHIKVKDARHILWYLTPKVSSIDVHNTIQEVHTIQKALNGYHIPNEIHDTLDSDILTWNLLSKEVKRIYWYELRGIDHQGHILDTTHIYDIGAALSQERVSSSVIANHMNMNIQRYPKHTHKILLPKLEYPMLMEVSKLIHQLHYVDTIRMFVRGATSMTEFFNDKEKLKCLLIDERFLHGNYLILDTDELHYHLDQIKPHHMMLDIIIDSDALIKDIYDVDSSELSDYKTYKTLYLHLLQDAYRYLKKIKVNPMLVSSKIADETFFNMFKATGFKKFIYRGLISKVSKDR